MVGKPQNERKTLVLLATASAEDGDAVATTLEAEGFRVSSVGTGSAALEFLQGQRPDAVVLGRRLPDRDGLAVCEAIRALHTQAELPVFMIVDAGDADAGRRAFAAGASEIVDESVPSATLPERIRHTLETARSLSDLTGLVRAIPDLIFIVNETGEVQDGLSGPDAAHTLKLKALQTAAEVDFYPCENDDNARACIRRALETGRPQVYEHVLESHGIHLETRFVARDKHSVLAIVRDITERKEAEAEIYNLAYYDELTELPNRELFSQSLERTIRHARREDQKFAVLFVDLDRFKRINDTLGHSIGDELLKEVAARLASCIRSTDLVSRVKDEPAEAIRLARLGGDEFVIKVYGIENDEAITAIAARIISELTPPFSCLGHQFVVTPSIGIAVYPKDGTTSEELLMNADSAMYRAKSFGRNNFKFYSETMRTKSLHRLDLENHIRTAIEEQQFRLHFQPKVNVRTNRLVGAEALLRWEHPERGAIGPAEFIPVAEETGLIVPIGQWVLREACREVRAWGATAVGAVPVSVNISSHQFGDRGLGSDVWDALSAAGIDANLLELEITESVFVRDVENTLLELQALKRSGVSLSIDDFGTGYSSLSYLKRFPIDTIKIDRSFVEDLQRDSDDAAICAAILAMSLQLGLKVVAEGVETREQLEFLRRHGCHHVQGYIFRRPLSAAEFRGFLADLGAAARNPRKAAG